MHPRMERWHGMDDTRRLLVYIIIVVTRSGESRIIIQTRAHTALLQQSEWLHSHGRLAEDDDAALQYC